MKRTTPAAVLLASMVVAADFPASGQSPPAFAEATSLLGAPLRRPAIADEARARMEAQLAEARAMWTRDQADADAIIWLGRRTAYLGRFREAIDIFTEGMVRHADDARMYRHRGHRFLTIREIDRAIADLAHADELMRGRPDQIEPDGQPNARNIPTSSLRSNILYHLALARYLKGDFPAAASTWRKARAALDNADHLVATSHWLYLSLRRSGQDDEARAVLTPIRSDLDVIENSSYHALLLMYKGERTADDVLAAAGSGSSGSAVRYGVGAWHFVSGRADEAQRLWRSMIEAPDWPSFGNLAAEAELARK